MFVFFIFVFILFVYWFVCGWYSIGLSEIQSGIFYGWLIFLFNIIGDVFYFVNIIVNFDVIGGFGKGMWYLILFYFIFLCMIGVGFGNVVVNIEYEKLFLIFMMIIGGKYYIIFFCLFLNNLLVVFGNICFIFFLQFFFMYLYFLM